MKQHRICIIGAGVSGIATAYFLAKRGYKNITIFEKEDHIGGKIASVRINNRNINTGAIIVTRQEDGYESLLREHDIPYETKLQAIELYKDGVFYDIAPFFLTAQKLYLEKKFGNAHKNAPHNTIRDFASYEELGKLSAYFISMNSTGYIENNSSTHLNNANLIPLLNEVMFGMRGWLHCPYGFDYVLTKIVERHQLDVRLSEEIQSITRDEIIDITTNKGTYKFDIIILTVPIRNILQILDITKEEAILKNIVANTYFTAVMKLRTLNPRRPYTLICTQHNIHKINYDTPCALFYFGDDIYMVGSLVSPKTNKNTVLEQSVTYLTTMNYYVETVYTTCIWEHFHRLKGNNQGNSKTDLNKIQGNLQTYFAHEVFTTPTVNGCVAHARSLVDNYF